MTTTLESKAKTEAKQLFEEFYQIIFELGGELSEEIIISLLAIRTAALAVEKMIKNNKSLEIQLSIEKGVTENEYLEAVKQELLKL